MALDPNHKVLSGVTGRFQLEAPDSIQATLKVTMTLGMWKAVREALDGKSNEYGCWQLDAIIRDMISSASAQAYARIEASHDIKSGGSNG
jgi:hypothetical protein